MFVPIEGVNSFCFIAMNEFLLALKVMVIIYLLSLSLAYPTGYQIVTVSGFPEVTIIKSQFDTLIAFYWFRQIRIALNVNHD